MATNSSVTSITNYDAGTPNDNATRDLGNVRAIHFTHEKLADNTDGDIIQLARLRSDWVVLSIRTSNDALTGATDVDIGLYTDATPDTATAKDADVYADGVSIASANKDTERAFHTRDLAKMGNYVWQDAGLSAAPEKVEYYRLTALLNTGGSATGTISGYVLVMTPS